MEATGRNMHLTVVSPSSTLFDGPAEYVQLPVHDGMIGILPHHAPLVSVLGYGLLTLRAGGREQRYQVDGGFLEIRDNRVSVLADAALAPQDIDFARADQDLQEALALPAVGDEAIEARWNRVAAARSRVRLKPR